MINSSLIICGLEATLFPGAVRCESLEMRLDCRTEFIFPKKYYVLIDLIKVFDIILTGR